MEMPIIVRFLGTTFAVAAAVSTVGCIESQLEPRAPDALVLRQPTGAAQWISESMPTPAAEDSFWQNAQPSLQARPPVTPIRSVDSLGFIGDQPLGMYGSPPHRQESWTRPFPSSWTHTSQSYGRRYTRR